MKAPIVLSAPEPQLRIRRAICVIRAPCWFICRSTTTACQSKLRLIRPLGLGLDEQALLAVRRYKFKPATENGKPVGVEMNVEVNFQIF